MNHGRGEPEQLHIEVFAEGIVVAFMCADEDAAAILMSKA